MPEPGAGGPTVTRMRALQCLKLDRSSPPWKLSQILVKSNLGRNRHHKVVCKCWNSKDAKDRGFSRVVYALQPYCSPSRIPSRPYSRRNQRRASFTSLTAIRELYVEPSKVVSEAEALFAGTTATNGRSRSHTTCRLGLLSGSRPFCDRHVKPSTKRISD